MVAADVKSREVREFITGMTIGSIAKKGSDVSWQ